MQSYQGGVYEEPGDFQTRADEIASNIKKISQNVSSISKMVNQLQTHQDSQELRNQLRQIQNYTQKMAKDTSLMIMDLMKLPAENSTNKLYRERLSDEYMATLNSFQATQRLAAQKTKEDVKKTKASSMVIDIGDPHSVSANNGKEMVEMNDSLRRQEFSSAQADHTLVELEQRERDVRQLEEDIVAVNDIFKDLGTLIHTQGAVVDSIESHVEFTAENVESGVQQLREASSSQNKLRKRKVYIGIIVMIVVAIILYLVFS